MNPWGKPVFRNALLHSGLLLFIGFLGCKTKTETDPLLIEHFAPLIHRIAFGSCGSQDQPQPVLDLAVSQKPDLFIWLGDNIYGDSEIPDTLDAKYKRLAAKQEFKNLEATCPMIGTWDDHDYGSNDAGRHYPLKLKSKELFLDFWKVPKEDIRFQRDGIYTSYYYQSGEHTLQIIVLDLRTFRDDLKRYNGEEVDTVRFFYDLDYLPYETTDSTLLGETQWKWLEKQLTVPADLRIIASSSQFGITFNGYEAWANFPHEQKRFLELIKSTKANGVVFISGDVHYAEISKLTWPGIYPVYDVTASGITSTWDFATPNDNRIDGAVMENHFGLLEMDWEAAVPTLNMKIIDVSGKTRIDRTIALKDLQLPVQ
jgi:alkaline phosphatase D